jgi:hypothetical protein
MGRANNKPLNSNPNLNFEIFGFDEQGNDINIPLSAISNLISSSVSNGINLEGFQPNSLLVVNDEATDLEELVLSGNFIIEVVDGKKTLSLVEQVDVIPTNPLVLNAILNNGDVDLSWIASVGTNTPIKYTLTRSNNGFVSSFLVMPPTADVTTFKETNIDAVGTWTYKLSVEDANGESNGDEPTASVTFVEDTEAPTTPLNLTSTVDELEATLSWEASTDNFSVEGYELQYITQQQFIDSGLDSDIAFDTYAYTFTEYTTSRVIELVNGNYIFRVRAFDTATPANYSNYSNEETVTIAFDQEVPTAPTLDVVINGTDAECSWSVSSDDIAVTNYRLLVALNSEVDFSNPISTFSGNLNTHTFTSLANGEYKFMVYAEDAVGNKSEDSNVVVRNVGSASDTEAPSSFVLSLDNAQSDLEIGTVALDWTTPTDNDSISGFLLQWGAGVLTDSTFTTVGGGGVGKGLNTSAIIGLGNTQADFTFRVRASDPSGNYSYSNVVSVQVGADTESPSDFTLNLGSQTDTSTGQVFLEWTASSDNVGVVNYTVETASGYNTPSTFASNITGSVSNGLVLDKNLFLTGGKYSFRVKAEDAAGNFTYSNIEQIKVTIVIQSSQVYFGQSNSTFVTLDSDFFEDSLTGVNPNYNLEVDLLILGSQEVSVPFLGNPFDVGSQNYNKRTHFIAIPASLNMFSSVSQDGFSTLYNGSGINLYSTSLISINSENYNLWQYTAPVPLNQNILIGIQ